MNKKDYEDALQSFNINVDHDDIVDDTEVMARLSIFLMMHHKAIKQALQDKINSGWQSIDSAPKDGTHVLIYHYEYSDEQGILTAEYKDGGWYCTEYDAWKYQPTHWMPLPNPPKENNNE